MDVKPILGYGSGIYTTKDILYIFTLIYGVFRGWKFSIFGRRACMLKLWDRQMKVDIVRLARKVFEYDNNQYEKIDNWSFDNLGVVHVNTFVNI